LAADAAAISPLGAGTILDTTERFQSLADAGRHDAGERSFGPPGGKPTDEAQRAIRKIYRLGAGEPVAGVQRAAIAERRRAASFLCWLSRLRRKQMTKDYWAAAPPRSAALPARRPGRRPRSQVTYGFSAAFRRAGPPTCCAASWPTPPSPRSVRNAIVETKTGASGFIANENVANATPDGRTIGLAAMAALCVSPVMPGQKLPINVDTDLTPIASIVGVYNMLVFGKHVPFRTVPELIEQAKRSARSPIVGRNGTSQHLASELFKLAGVNLHVPYRGTPAIQDIVAGNCDIARQHAGVPGQTGGRT
jgi:hypothetical protein